jgi:hypothetical protein
MHIKRDIITESEASVVVITADDTEERIWTALDLLNRTSNTL